MEFFYAHGAAGYDRVAESGRADLPRPQAARHSQHRGSRACARCMRLDPRPAIINVHATGGLDMMKAAAEAVAGQCEAHRRHDPHQPLGRRHLGGRLRDRAQYRGPCPDAGANWRRAPASMAWSAARMISRASGTIWDASSSLSFPASVRLTRRCQDQKRIATPAAAIAAGADILVIGRAITGAADPARAARDILAGLHAR